MKIIIHGTCNGYDILNQEKFEMIDARPDFNKVAAIGQEAYSINFKQNNAIFSKYKIIRDVPGDRRTGNIAFSIVIPPQEKMSGKFIKELLDELSDKFCSKHIINNNLENFREDWAFITELSEQFKNKLEKVSSNNLENYREGNADAAFVYYSDELELQKYFDFPNQSSYNVYKQIFFIEKSLKERDENPLNALRHNQKADLSKFEFDILKYNLKYKQITNDGTRVDVKVNNRIGINEIRRNDELEIIWSKQFFDEKKIKGTINNLSSDYITIDNNEKTIYINEIRLNPTIYNFNFETKDSSKIVSADIFLLKNDIKEKNVLNNKITLSALEMHNNKWSIIAYRDNLISEQKDLNVSDSNKTIVLNLQKYIKVKFNIFDNNGPVTNYKINIENKKVQPSYGEVNFIGDEINTTWIIKIYHNDYEPETFLHFPKNGDKDITLRKKVKTSKSHNTKYFLEIDEKKGKKTYNGDKLFGYIREIPRYKCGSKYGYKFVKWELIEIKSSQENEKYYRAIFKELWYCKIPKATLIGIPAALVIFIISYFIWTAGSGENKELDAITNKIKDYVEGNELNKDTLESYKKQCVIVAEKSTRKLIWPFGSDDSEKINELVGLLDNAISIRTAIIEGNIDKLQERRYFQKSFEEVVKGINEKLEKQISDSLKAQKAEQMNLDEVVALITRVQNGNKQAPKNEENNPTEKKAEVPNLNGQNQTSTNTTAPKANSKAESNLETEFWELVHNTENKRVKYSDLYNKYKEIVKKDNKYIVYLYEIYKTDYSFENKFLKIPAKSRKKANNLTEIKLLIK
jgi:hypothetical protein